MTGLGGRQTLAYAVASDTLERMSLRIVDDRNHPTSAVRYMPELAGLPYPFALTSQEPICMWLLALIYYIV